ncbi:alpha-glucuronidase family glycosyl hydrolase [Sorangium sp. So ce1014]|uniref:alpha-glucuronidase family glycosyl hydrolase n=1 Tax=Sorangium sp. So ce1014 TaxID=3133326 RepID=UPI003F60AF2E
MTILRVPLLLVGLLGVALTSACSSSGANGSNGTTGGGGGAGLGGAGGDDGVGGSGGVIPGSGGGTGTGTGTGTGGSTGTTGGESGSDEVYPVPDSLPDETGADLWLRYPQVPIPGRLGEYQAAFKRVVKSGSGASLDIAEAELVKGLSGLTGATVDTGAAVDGPGAVVIGTATADIIKDLPLAARLAALGPEGYLIETADVGGQSVIAVAGNTEVGVLYGTFALLRHAQSHSSLTKLSLSGSPKVENRILNHWDNLDRTVERGYAGRSIWDWNALPGTLSPRYKDYARANASIGINGTVLTNVNANAQVLTASYLTKVKALADVFRPYGIKVYLTARFSAPIEIGNLSTADPTNASVKQWWVNKVDEIYRQIPDFGGFLVKANSEGQPGPQDYGRNHADGANMLADALAPHKGIVMWRAFVYSDDSPPDRIKEAYEEFKPLDGKFKGNVLVQAKNGPLDFQPREPFHPLFGAMPKTPLVLELQITKEYLGEDTHLAYLGPMFEEVLKADTHADGAGSTVARVIDGTLHDYATTAIAGVANVGDDANWTGSHMNQANWYVFGRLAWNPDLSSESIAEEWVRQTFSSDPVVREPVVEMMMKSRDALADYMTPLGLVHIMGNDHHYGPAPWANTLSRAEWNPVYYHKANESGIGFDRSPSGSNAVAQYFGPVGQQFGSRETVPEDLLLFFHRVGWKDELSSGRTVWEELVHQYSSGVDEVGLMREAWESVKGRIDEKRFGNVTEFLEIQHYEARWWRDACLAYFGQVSKLQIPSGYAAPANSLSFYQGLRCPGDVKKPRCSQVYTGDPSPAILP